MASYTYSFPLRSCFMMRLRQTNVHSKFVCDCLCRCCSVIGVVAGSPSKYSRHYPLQTHQRAVPNAARWNTKNMDFPTITDIHGNARLSYGSTTRELVFPPGKTPATNHLAPTNRDFWEDVLFPVPIPTLMSHVTTHKLH